MAEPPPKSLLPNRSPRTAERNVKRIHTSVAMTEDIAVAVRLLCAEKDQSMSDMLNECVAYYLDAQYPEWRQWIERENDWCAQVERT